jgi:membrane fusion protein, heavy metal efflux system
VSVDAAPGAFVEAGASVFHIVDPTQLWLEARIPAVDASRVSEVRGAWFEVDGVDEPFEVGADALAGRSQRVDPVTRTLPLLFDIDNAAGRLPVGAFARVHVVVEGESRAVAVPKAGVVDDNGQSIVFVQAEGESFERRIVSLGQTDRGYVAVLSGVAPGERVVSRGAWSVKLAASSGAIPAHGHSH